MRGHETATESIVQVVDAVNDPTIVVADQHTSSSQNHGNTAGDVPDIFGRYRHSGVQFAAPDQAEFVRNRSHAARWWLHRWQ
jgi:hypothetical protein